MFIRTTKHTQGGKTYKYTQIVESVRREPDGMPVHNVLAHLGRCSPLQVENLRIALRASAKGARVVVASIPKPKKGEATKPTASLQYLDLAVLLETWRSWGVDSLLQEIMPDGNSKVSPSAIVTALVLQSCVNPGSDLAATQWLPYTALPELLGIPLKSFNNTRIHRVLDQLEQIESTLIRKLPRLIAEHSKKHPAFARFYLDVTDTWFVRHGAPIAEPGKTKEGFVKQKIGIVLLCNEDGYPLRWEVVSGSSSDGDVMAQMINSMSGLSWVGETPVVCDRAMGRTAYLQKMLATDVRFLTALTRTEFSTYAPGLPWEKISKLIPQGTKPLDKEVDAVAKCAEEVGLKKIAENLFFMDCQTVTLAQDFPPLAVSFRSGKDSTVEAMRLCREVWQDVEDGHHLSVTMAGRARGLKKGLVYKYSQLNALPTDVQNDILEGKAAGYSLAELIEVAKSKDLEERRIAFHKLLSAPPKKQQRPSASLLSNDLAPSDEHPIDYPNNTTSKVRVVAYFNPQLFIDRRKTAARRLKEISLFVENLNRELTSPRSRRTREKIAVIIDTKLRKYDLLDAFTIKIFDSECSGRRCHQVQLDLKSDEWEKRRRYDGFTVLVAHPELKQNAEELCMFYRNKDKIEKDFGVIKGLLELRPLQHRTDEKVRAHVTLRMLGLLLERTLNKKLLGSYSPRAALEHLRHCTVEYYELKDERSFYGIIEPNEQHLAILRTLRLQHLVDDREFNDMITPREVL
jgi:transposase